MRAEEGDESINDYAHEAEQAQDNVVPERPLWQKLWRALTFRRGN